MSGSPSPRAIRIGLVTAVVVVATVFVAGPDRDDSGGDAPSDDPPVSGLADGREFCDAYLAVSRADDQFLADGTPRAAAALEDAVADLVPVAARTDLSDEERAGLGVVVTGIVGSAGLPQPDLAADGDPKIPFAEATTAFAGYLSRSCGAQLGPGPG